MAWNLFLKRSAHIVHAISSWSCVFRTSEQLHSQWMNAVNSFIARAVSLARVWESNSHQLGFIFVADDYSISLDL